MPVEVNVQLETPAVQYPQGEGLTFPESGEGLTLGPEGLPLKFAVVPGDEVPRSFPAYIPSAEQLVWDVLNDQTESCVVFPEDSEQGLVLPLEFSTPPGIGLFAGTDPVTYPTVNGIPNAPVMIIKGWPTYPGQIPSIGVAVATENEDGAQRLGQGGFAGDAYAYDEQGNITATCAYYAEPMYSVVVVELIHENRDERDRLHNQIRLALYPLRHIVPGSNPLIKEIQLQSEKQELPVDEQPLTLYISVFTVEVWSEALIPTEVIISPAVVERIDVTVDAEQP